VTLLSCNPLGVDGHVPCCVNRGLRCASPQRLLPPPRLFTLFFDNFSYVARNSLTTQFLSRGDFFLPRCHSERGSPLFQMLFAEYHCRLGSSVARTAYSPSLSVLRPIFSYFPPVQRVCERFCCQCSLECYPLLLVHAFPLDLFRVLVPLTRQSRIELLICRFSFSWYHPLGHSEGLFATLRLGLARPFSPPLWLAESD